MDLTIASGLAQIEQALVCVRHSPPVLASPCDLISGLLWLIHYCKSNCMQLSFQQRNLDTREKLQINDWCNLGQVLSPPILKRKSQGDIDVHCEMELFCIVHIVH